MTDQRGRAGEPPLTEEQAKRKLAEVQAELARNQRVAERSFSHNVMLANDRLEFVKKELAATMQHLAAIEPFRGHPDGEHAYMLVGFLATTYSSIQKMMEIDLDCHGFNLELVEKPELLDGEDFRSPEKYLSYIEARVRLDLALAYYYWMRDIESIDTLLRAAQNGRAVIPRTEQEEQQRRNQADGLRESMKADRDMAMLAGTIAQHFVEALELMEWGISRLPELNTRNAQVKREILTDPKWAKLNGKVQTVMGAVPTRVKGMPALARLFPASTPQPLPFTLAADPMGQGGGRSAALQAADAAKAGLRSTPGSVGVGAVTRTAGPPGGAAAAAGAAAAVAAARRQSTGQPARPALDSFNNTEDAAMGNAAQTARAAAGTNRLPAAPPAQDFAIPTSLAGSGARAAAAGAYGLATEAEDQAAEAAATGPTGPSTPMPAPGQPGNIRPSAIGFGRPGQPAARGPATAPLGGPPAQPAAGYAQPPAQPVASYAQPHIQPAAGYPQASAQAGVPAATGYPQTPAQAGVPAVTGYPQAPAQAGVPAATGYPQAPAQAGVPAATGYPAAPASQPPARTGGFGQPARPAGGGQAAAMAAARGGPTGGLQARSPGLPGGASGQAAAIAAARSAGGTGLASRPPAQPPSGPAPSGPPRQATGNPQQGPAAAAAAARAAAARAGQQALGALPQRPAIGPPPPRPNLPPRPAPGALGTAPLRPGTGPTGMAPRPAGVLPPRPGTGPVPPRPAPGQAPDDAQ